ncbi:Hypothetical protein NCS54_00920400 [Fusarium falciforme]|uniref:Hypothetical protein n=1 Tax=Fusarium falciforme TaxID=195108 RepID=UPI0022FFE1AC|nr:Hypothetical protein NCS54_00920400 [Fusarium falciforme]WAO91724.1 Hypothetical protein NCS54_00920400 [Fusarium falciforme]
MFFPTFYLFTSLGGVFAASIATRAVNTEQVDISWVGLKPEYLSGVTFGVPWPRGKFSSEETEFRISTGPSQSELQSWVTGYWPDGSIKWSGHALPASSPVPDGYTISASGPGIDNSTTHNRAAGPDRREVDMMGTDSGDEIIVDTGKIRVKFPKSGPALIGSIETAGGKIVGQNGKLIVRSLNNIQDLEDEHAKHQDLKTYECIGRVTESTIEKDSSIRALVTVRGLHHSNREGLFRDYHKPWVPFVVRFYLYKDSEAIRMVHSIVYDGNSDHDFIAGIGIHFDIPLADEELYNRHIRIAGPDGGFLSEAVKGITGLRRDPGAAVRQAQVAGRKTPDASTWDSRVTSRLHWIPAWSDYRLTQLSPDGFNLKKRTAPGQSWVKISGATRAGGLAYLGGPTVGGLAVGLRDFWKKYPTSIDISNAAHDLGSITLWLYSPSAEPMDLRPYHDGLGQDTYEKQLDALEITYEDYEPGWNTPYGIGRTSEVYIYGFESTPSQDKLAILANHTNEPPVLYSSAEKVRESKALGDFWNVPGATTTTTAAATIESNLRFLTNHYQQEALTRRFYGFWDHGDFHHTYDSDRHTWRYDVGGYAWDNSEISPDIFFWYQFLRTGDIGLYRFAEAQVRHGSDTDTYHIGDFKGLGTRHGVQHWGDSSKQIRISTPIYRRIFYFISGGDERIGEVMHEVLDAEQSFLNADTGRKVRDPNTPYTPDPTRLSLGVGTEWSNLAMAFLIEWERRGPRWQEARTKLLKGANGIAKLKFGLVSGSLLYNSRTGDVKPPLDDPDNEGRVGVGSLQGSFGMLETLIQFLDHVAGDVPDGLKDALLDYCYYYGAGSAEQRSRYGETFSVNLRQGHSKFSAYSAHEKNNATTAARAWREFFNSDGFKASQTWNPTVINNSSVLVPIVEAAWISSNSLALYGMAAIVNLALIGDQLQDS